MATRKTHNSLTLYMEVFVPSPNQPADKTTSPTHQSFQWITGIGQNEPLADFVELTRDISAGINTCLQIVFASDLEHANNEDADPGCTSPPSIDKISADTLLRFSIAASALLRRESDAHIQRLNNMQTR